MCNSASCLKKKGKPFGFLPFRKGPMRGQTKPIRWRPAPPRRLPPSWLRKKNL